MFDRNRSEMTDRLTGEFELVFYPEFNAPERKTRKDIWMEVFENRISEGAGVQGNPRPSWDRISIEELR